MWIYFIYIIWHLGSALQAIACMFSIVQIKACMLVNDNNHLLIDFILWRHELTNNPNYTMITVIMILLYTATTKIKMHKQPRAISNIASQGTTN